MAENRAFSIRNLIVRYPGAAASHPALGGISLDLPAGKVTAIVGQSGSGKTTLGLSLLGALPRNAEVSGRILYGNTDITALSVDEVRRHTWGKVWGVVPQLPRDALSPLRSIGAHLADARRGAGKMPLTMIEATSLLHDFGLFDAARILRAYPHELSGGMLQRILCAMADAGEPSWILADEPTKGLDPATWQMTADSLAKLTRRGAGLILITHDMPLARRLADRIIVLHKGHIIDAPPQPSPPLAELPSPARVPRRDAPVLLEARYITSIAQDRTTGDRRTLLQSCSLRIREGLSVGLEGASGAGKSTIARIMLGLLAPDAGAVYWRGTDIALLPKKMRTAFCRSTQLVAQNPEQAFDPRRTIEESLLEVYAIHPVLLDHLYEGKHPPPSTFSFLERWSRNPLQGKEVRSQIASVLDEVDLRMRVLSAHPHELSGGELQRAVICRALLSDPTLLILDEPTTMLDGATERQVVDLLLRLKRERAIATLLISHHHDLLTGFCDEILLLKDGQVKPMEASP